MNDKPSTLGAEPDFPMARVVQDSNVRSMSDKLVSRFWIITLLCFLFALGLVWFQWDSYGPRVVITWNEGYGLVPGDPVRFRGIDVGEVVSVKLHKNLAKVNVSVRLHGESRQLAREGTRFWVERPDIRLGQVRGLETLVGGRYVGVTPGPADAQKATWFEGLQDAPTALENVFDGLEIVLESPHRFGLQRGSPVSYRGVEIGHVMRVGLTNDAVNVVARTYIQPEYRSLVREGTQFWSNSGMNIRFGLRGLELDAETLATVVAGGVALATPTTSPGHSVVTGHRFELHETSEEEWLEWQPRLAIGSATLPEDLATPQPVLGICRNESGFAVFGRTQRRGWLLMLDSGKILAPTDMLLGNPEEEFVLSAWGKKLPLGEAGIVKGDALSLRDAPEELQGEELVAPWSTARIRFATVPEEVVISCGSDDMMIPLLPARMTATDQGWQIDSKVPLDEGWHGASVVAAHDGSLVGVLVHAEEGMRIVPLKKELLE